MASFSTPLSGLKAAQSELQTISNNLANVNTTGYKSQSLTFTAVFEQSGATNGAGDPVQTGSGSSLSSTVTDTSDGTANKTNVSSNMAITGNGYFVIKSSSGQTQYSRDGSFVTNNLGQIVTSQGALLMGYPATNGVVNTSASLQPISVGTGIAIPASASTEISITANLDSTTAVGKTATTSSVPVYDSLGEKHNVSVAYTKTAENQWLYTATVPSSELKVHQSYESSNSVAISASTTLVAGDTFSISDAATGKSYTYTASTGDTVQKILDGVASAVSSGTLSSDVTARIDSSGKLVVSESTTRSGITASTTSSALGGAMSLPETTTIGSGTLIFNSAGVLQSIENVTPMALTNLADGADSMPLSGPFGSVGSATITQTATTSGTSATSTDGYSAGTLSSYAIDPDGTVEGTFSSGKTIALGQVAIASFANVQGMKAVGDNAYQATNASGAAVVGPAETGGRGTIQGGYVEASNVDIASEFAKLIVAQQAYSASAKSITTFNQMSQATLQMLQ